MHLFLVLWCFYPLMMLSCAPCLMLGTIFHGCSFTLHRIFSQCYPVIQSELLASRETLGSKIELKRMGLTQHELADVDPPNCPAKLRRCDYKSRITPIYDVQSAVR